MYRGVRQERGDLYTEEQIRRVLAAAGVRVEGEVDSDFLVFCPYHNNFRTPAGEVDKEAGTFFCFSCHKVKDLRTFLMDFTKKTYFQVDRMIHKYKEDVDILDLVNNKLVTVEEYKAYDQELIKRLNREALDSPRAMQYFAGRQITESSVKRFTLGFSQNQDMVTIPQYDPSGQTCVGFVARSVEGKDFKNTPKLPKSKILFNLHRAKYEDTVYVVESSFDAIRLEQAGIAAVATLGSNVSNKQVDLLTKHFNSAIIIPDNDEAGRDMANNLIRKMGSRANSIGLPSRFKDIGDMTDADITKLQEITEDPLLSNI